MRGSVPESPSIDIGDVRFTAAPPTDVGRGLLGWAHLTLNRVLRLDGIAVRRTLEGRVTISFPSRRDRAGREHKFMRPVNSWVGREIEHQVLTALGYREGDSR